SSSRTTVPPGECHLALPISTSTHPPLVTRSSGWNPPADRGPADFRRIFTLPQHQAALPNPQLSTNQGEETLANTRVGKALFLTWGSEVEPTLRVIEHQGRIGKRTWIAAPIYELGSIPAASTDVDPETGVRVPLRDLIRRGKARRCFLSSYFPW